MQAYNGINRHTTGIHSPLSRQQMSAVLRKTRQTNRKDALAWRNWIIYLGTYPCKPIGDHNEWCKRIANQTRAFLRRFQEDN